MKMILIVESGSTKTDWVKLLPSGETTLWTTSGINPTTMKNTFSEILSSEIIETILQADKILYYGAGTGNKTGKSQILNFFSNLGYTGFCSVETDLTATAHGLCQDKPGIVGILGTGSNAGIYNGQTITYNPPSLGYIIGDEGGAVQIGKLILTGYFYGTMPEEIKQQFHDTYSITKEELLDKVYRNNSGSAYIASFSLFTEVIEHPWKDTIIEKAFTDFVENRILPLKQKQDYSTFISGSVAYGHRDKLVEILYKHHVKYKVISKSPLKGLIDYHLKTSFQ